MEGSSSKRKDLLRRISALNCLNSLVVVKFHVVCAWIKRGEFKEVDCFFKFTKQLDRFIFNMKLRVQFLNHKCNVELSQNLLEKKRHIVYPLVYLLVKLVLILLMNIVFVEMIFSTMKNKSRNKMIDHYIIWTII